MRILIICQHYLPEEVGIGFQIHQLAVDLQQSGHTVTVLTAFPNYPKRVIFKGYRRKLFMRETIEGVDVIRTWVYANPKETFASRLLNWGSFCLSAALGTLIAVKKPDIIHVLLPPLPLGASINMVGKLKGTPVTVHVQDIYPLLAVELGILRNKRIIRFFEKMERKVYKQSSHITVISNGFKENLISKGVPSCKISIVPNWADTNFVQPGTRENAFRSEMGAEGKFLVLYSGGLTRNSNLEPVIRAAALLKDEPFVFAIVGDGPLRGELQSLADGLQLTNLRFLPFQPLARYPEVLQAADVTLVALNYAATFASVPSKVMKQMAAGRPVLAITSANSELARLVDCARCGIRVPTDDSESLAGALRWALSHREELEKMGENGRKYLEDFHCRQKCTAEIEVLLRNTVQCRRNSMSKEDPSVSEYASR